MIRKYTWGLDLAAQGGAVNSLEGAGGVAGLLALEDLDQGTPQTAGFLYLYDANGNAGQLIDADDGTVAVKYQYDPYGARVNLGLAWELNQPFRFSTKYLDAETGLSYFGYRYYSPRLGRWINRDPMEESGATNLYLFVSNRPTGLFDPLGNKTACCYYDARRLLIGPLRPKEAVTVNCPADIESPTKCCECCLPKRKHLAKASWGKCCFCTVQVGVLTVNLPLVGEVQLPGAHERIVVVCDNGEQVVAQMRGSVDCGYDPVEVCPQYPRYNPGWAVRIWGGPQAIRIDCDCAARLIAQLKSLEGKKLLYIVGLWDCRAFARDWFERFKRLPCYHDPAASEESLKRVDLLDK